MRARHDASDDAEDARRACRVAPPPLYESMRRRTGAAGPSPPRRMPALPRRACLMSTRRRGHAASTGRRITESAAMMGRSVSAKVAYDAVSRYH